MTQDIATILDRYGEDRTELMDVLWDIQHSCGYIPAEAVSVVAVRLGLTPEDVMETKITGHPLRHRQERRRPEPSQGELEEAAELIANAEHPIVLAGNGVSRGSAAGLPQRGGWLPRHGIRDGRSLLAWPSRP